MLDSALIRDLVPGVLSVLVRRGWEFAAAEDAVQEALIEALRRWPAGVPADPRGWLITVAGRKLIDQQRSEVARRRREEAELLEPAAGPTEQGDDALVLIFLCCHPSLSPASAVALTLRAVGGLTTKQIADAFLVPEATMAQRISRAKKTLTGVGLSRPGEVSVVLRVLYLIFNEGYAGSVDLAAEAIRLVRGLSRELDDPEVAGLLALMLLHHARRGARFTDKGALIPLDEQDRSLWDVAEIAEGVAILQTALAQDRIGEYQMQAAIAALHDDAASAVETDWVQILAWYDDLLTLTGNPAVALNRAVAVGQVDGPLAGLRSLDPWSVALTGHHRLDAVVGHLHERAGNHLVAADHYASAAARASSTAERDHLTRQAARLRSAGAADE